MTQPVACRSPASWGPRASITERPCLEQKCLGLVGLSWGGVPSWGYQEEMRAGNLVLRAECAAGSEAGGQQRKEVCLQPP